MQILIIGAGVIGSVYGAHLGAAGHAVSVLAHGLRTEAVATVGLVARDAITSTDTRSPADVVGGAGEGAFDLVLVALRRDHLHRAAMPLSELNGRPLVLFLGNNPAGRRGLPEDHHSPVSLGFPGVGGTLAGDVATFVKIPQQPTALDTTDDPRMADVAATLRAGGFAVQRVSDMEGWLMYHAVFVACVSAALYHCGTDPLRLAGNRPEMKLMCQAITAGFTALRTAHVRGLATNLAVLHSRYLTPIATRYWRRTMRTPMGELAFAAHCRHAETEMRALAHDVVLRLVSGDQPDPLRRLLAPTA